MERLRTGIGLMLAIGNSFGSQAAPVGSQAPKGIIEGRVLNLNTGAPIRKAVVQLTGLPARPGAQQIETVRETAGEGYFSFAGLEPGRYELTAWRDGFLKQPLSMRRSGVMRILLASDEHRNDVILKLTPMSVITGRVVDEVGEPVMNLEVSALKQEYRKGKREWVQAFAGQTSDLGEYRLTMLAPGRYLVATRSR